MKLDCKIYVILFMNLFIVAKDNFFMQEPVIKYNLSKYISSSKLFIIKFKILINYN